MHLSRRIRSIGPIAAAFARELARDRAGNTLMLVAASLMPLLAMIGGGVDMSRSYLSQSRLQQACDAGVLAARKELGTQGILTGDIPDDVDRVGHSFFNVNFRDGAYGTADRDFVMTLEEDYSISGDATVNVPTTIMRIFGYTNVPVRVSCTAQLNMSNTDVMLVLDTTGSMRTINPGDTMMRIEALQAVAKSFYRQLEASKGSSRVRYGFVPYASNVNVGWLLRSGWTVDEWQYQGRRATAGGTRWSYRPIVADVSVLKGAGDNDPMVGGTVSLPMLGWPGAPAAMASTFLGCIEERVTYEIDDYSNVDLTRAMDLDLDRIPDPADPDT